MCLNSLLPTVLLKNLPSFQVKQDKGQGRKAVNGQRFAENGPDCHGPRRQVAVKGICWNG